MSGKVNARQCLLVSLLSLIVVVLLREAGKYWHLHSLSSRRLHRTILMPASATPPPSVSMDTVFSAQNITFPHGSAVRPDVLSAPWVSTLQETLSQFTTKQLNIVVSDGKFQSVVLNWLIAALVKCDQPLENVLVIALDHSLFEVLHQRRIAVVYIDSTAVVHPDTQLESVYSHIWVTRMTVLRLISSWGYDITAYDSDAIVMRNPQVLFDRHGDKDLIGSAGMYPFPLGRKWGLTFCMGVAHFRHTERTELLWETLSSVKNSTFDDQVKLNYALAACNITWSAAVIRNETVEGTCDSHMMGGLRVAVLSHSSVCRKQSCTSSYYIIHRNSRKDSLAKEKVAKAHQVWFLREDWMERGAELTGTKWLEAISTPSN